MLPAAPDRRPPRGTPQRVKDLELLARAADLYGTPEIAADIRRGDVETIDEWTRDVLSKHFICAVIDYDRYQLAALRIRHLIDLWGHDPKLLCEWTGWTADESLRPPKTPDKGDLHYLECKVCTE